METLVSLLPFYNTPLTLLYSNGLPCHGAKIESKPMEYILREIKRQVWVEGLYVQKKDLSKIIRYKKPDGQYKNDFDKKQFLDWTQTIENNTVLCEMENKNVGKGIFIPPGKLLPRGTFIPSSGIIKLEPTIEEFETKFNCSALQDLNSPEKEIVGLIDPEKRGGILNFINHAPDKEEITNFIFKESSTEKNVATSNLRSMIKFYDGYAIMGLEAFEDISGGEYGTQLLWSYARSCEYIGNDLFNSDNKSILLFDNRDKHNGETIDVNKYALREITIFIDTGEFILQEVSSLTRWELMESSPDASLILTTEDPFSITQSQTVQSPISHGLIQKFLKKNPLADRVILQVPILKELEKVIKKKDKNDSN
ncbi:MAG: hypothetical protein WAW86_02240 [Gammaproteobacteria bacterium]